MAWDLDPGKEVVRFRGLRVAVRQTETSELVERLPGGKARRDRSEETGDPISAVALSADGRLALSAAGHYEISLEADEAKSGDKVTETHAVIDCTVRLWELASGRELWKSPPQEGPVYAAVLSPDGRKILAAGADRVIRVHALPARP